MNSFYPLLHEQRTFFNANHTLVLENRKQLLTALKTNIEKKEAKILSALQQDFKKSPFEGFVTEISILYLEIDNHLKNLNRWSRPKRVRSSLLNFPSSEYIYKQPYGSVLIIAPWNYPFLLAIRPLIAAIAAGNTVVLKPSELTPYTALILEELIRETFQSEWVTTVLGDADVTTKLLENKFDKIFFTGSTQVGKIIYQSAAKHLTPVVLELGGKSPCVITESANLELAAKRIVFGKFVNAGQTCIAPDFIWIAKKSKPKFIALLQQYILDFYGSDIQNNTDYPRIINAKNFNRLIGYLQPQQIICGGVHDEKELYIAPTILDNVHWQDPVMQEEIFGPVLPIVTYDDLEEVILYNQQNAKPLAFYMFSGEIKKAKKFMDKLQFGGGCINDVLSHIINLRVPFGGFGESGMGNYNGKFSFDVFSHSKTIVHRKNWLDLKMKYPPYQNKLTFIKKILSLLK